ncbi:hypothetical protein [Pseudomonas fluorescens]|uniref:hypothetical protein n=1 Tax=Pseudomonas fluorescens TaxID=294 RepID=UPI001654D958|nr:hypothetical protein [Pseudomonas fluorescens]MBC8784422.1 hypothetical protein [Pseudomonas fluorescens]
MEYCSFCSVFVSSGAVGAPTTPIATIFISGVVAVVGVIALFVAVAQMKIASAKVKLDLYNKRFNVYVATLEYYQSAYGKIEGSMRVKSGEFVKCYRESQFLFDKNDKIFDTLNRIMTHGNQILVYEETQSGATKVSQETAYLLHEKSVDARLAFEKDLILLEEQLAKYINFKTISGWRMFG